MSIHLKHVVLGLALEKPSHAYDLGRRAEDRFRWAGAKSGVYEACTTLVHAGHLGLCSGEPERIVYSGTEDGRQYFSEWLLEPSVFEWRRQELDVRIAFSGPREWPRLVEQIDRQEKDCLGELRDLAAVNGKPYSQSTRVTWPEAGLVLQRNAQMKTLETRIEYLQEVRELLQALVAQTPREL